jgi:pyruvate formate lyase activating enzyme
MPFSVEKRPLILDIKPDSSEDGPGIRSVVFFKGCPLSCPWCQNPESQTAGVQIAFDRDKCIECDSCLDVCVPGALGRDDPYFINRRVCTLCFRCEDVCPSGAIERVGKSMTADQIVLQVTQDLPFYKTSGGGCTFSGGEPTLFMEFVSPVAKRLRENGIHVLLETCGYYDSGQFTALLLPYLDLIYYDVKIHDSDEHRRLCGKGNHKILANFENLFRQYVDGGIEVMPRIPLIPGMTATEANLKSIASYLCYLGVEKVGLLANNPLWHEKNVKLGRRSVLSEYPLLRSWMSKEEIRYCQSFFKDFEIYPYRV